MSSDTRPTPARLKRLKEWCEPGKEGLAQTEAAELFVEIEALEALEKAWRPRKESNLRPTA